MILYYINKKSDIVKECGFDIQEGDICFLHHNHEIKTIYFDSPVDETSIWRDYRFLDSKSLKSYTFPTSDYILCKPYNKCKAEGNSQLLQKLIAECKNEWLTDFLQETNSILSGITHYWEIEHLRRFTRDGELQIKMEEGEAVSTGIVTESQGNEIENKEFRPSKTNDAASDNNYLVNLTPFIKSEGCKILISESIRKQTAVILDDNKIKYELYLGKSDQTNIVQIDKHNTRTCIAKLNKNSVLSHCLLMHNFSDLVAIYHLGGKHSLFAYRINDKECGSKVLKLFDYYGDRTDVFSVLQQFNSDKNSRKIIDESDFENDRVAFDIQQDDVGDYYIQKNSNGKITAKYKVPQRTDLHKLLNSENPFRIIQISAERIYVCWYEKDKSKTLKFDKEGNCLDKNFQFESFSYQTNIQVTSKKVSTVCRSKWFMNLKFRVIFKMDGYYLFNKETEKSILIRERKNRPSLGNIYVRTLSGEIEDSGKFQIIHSYFSKETPIAILSFTKDKVHIKSPLLDTSFDSSSFIQIK